jgi:hypothetical protein
LSNFTSSLLDTVLDGSHVVVILGIVMPPVEGTELEGATREHLEQSLFLLAFRCFAAMAWLVLSLRMELENRKETSVMKRFLSVVLAVAVVTVLAGAALAFMGPGGGMGPGRMGMGPGAMGMHGGPGGGMGPGMMGGAGPGAGPENCPGLTGTGQAQTPITEEKAKELATEYAGKYLTGYTVEKVLPFQGMRHTAYAVELKGPTGETRTLHVNPWGNVIPFGGPLAGTR